MKKTKTQKGITLIALIITIVVLLILAVVAIGAVRDSNIIAHAQNAAGSYNQAKANELDALATYETEIEKYLTEEKSDIQYYTVKVEGEGEVQEVVYALLKQGENYILKEYIGEANGQLLFQGEYNVYLEENKTATTIGREGYEVTIKAGSFKIVFEQDGEAICYLQDETIIAPNDGYTVTMTKATADVISRLVEEETVPNTVWAQRGLTVQPVETDVTYSCEAGIAFTGSPLSFNAELILELYTDGGFYLSMGLTDETGYAAVSGNNTVALGTSSEGDVIKFVFSEDATTCKVFALSESVWYEGDKTLTLNTASAE